MRAVFNISSTQCNAVIYMHNAGAVDSECLFVCVRATLHTLKCAFHPLLPQDPENCDHTFCFYDFYYFGTSFKWNYSVFVLWLFSAFETNPCLDATFFFGKVD